MFHQLMLVTQRQGKNLKEYLEFVECCLQNGVTSVQLREKSYSYDELLKFGKELYQLLAKYNVPLIINDNVDLALELNVEGVHLGQEDSDVLNARKLLGEEKIIGLSVNSNDQVLAANNLPVDYVGIGSIFETRNKKNVSNFWGCEGLREAVMLSKHKTIAIGGIELTNLTAVMETNVDGIAGIGIFQNSENVAETMKRLTEIMNKGK